MFFHYIVLKLCIRFISFIGPQGNVWNKAEVILPNPVPEVYTKVLFEAIRGSSYLSDIAIDDITITDQLCPESTIPPPRSTLGPFQSK